MVSISVLRLHLGADDDALAAGRLLLVDALVLGGAVGRVVGVAAAGAAAVEPDAVAGARDTKALARATAATRADAGRAGAVGRTGGERGDVGVVLGVVIGGFFDGLLGEAAVELLEGRLVVLGVDDLTGLVRALGLGGDDAPGGDTAALGDGGDGDAVGLAVGLAGGRRLLGGRDVDDVELAASGGLGGVVLSGVVRDVVAVDDVLEMVSIRLEVMMQSEGVRSTSSAGPASRQHLET